ncbi:MAG: hypothetical protein AAFX75_00340 [Pseudomonadota bacterium]
MLKQLAAWVLQSRHRLTIAVAFLLLVPLFNVVVPMVAVAGVLQFGPLAALPWIVGGWGIAGAIQVVFNPSPVLLIYLVSAGALASLAVLMGTVLGRAGSLTLTLQASLLCVLGLMAAFYVAVGDVAATWIAVFEQLLPAAREGNQQLSELSDQEIAEGVTFLADYLTGVAAASTYLSLAVGILGGYAMWDHGADKSRARFGRFRDLNLGRALAAALVLLAVVGSFLGWVPGANAAIVLLVAFGLHGCALAHWLRQRFEWPDWSLVVFYGVLAITARFSPFAIMLVCVAGYVDAWFNMVRVAPPGQAR